MGIDWIFNRFRVEWMVIGDCDWWFTAMGISIGDIGIQWLFIGISLRFIIRISLKFMEYVPLVRLASMWLAGTYLIEGLFHFYFHLETCVQSSHVWLTGGFLVSQKPAGVGVESESGQSHRTGGLFDLVWLLHVLLLVKLQPGGETHH